MERFLREVRAMDKIVIVVEKGMVQSVYGTHPYRTDIEILDLDCTDPVSYTQLDVYKRQALDSAICSLR